MQADPISFLLRSRDKNERLISQAVELGDYTQALPPLDAVNRGIRFAVKPNALTIQSHNPEQEEAEEGVEVGYEGPQLGIGLNVNYLMEALAAIEGPDVQIGLTDGNSSCLIRSGADEGSKHVVMPMRP